MTTKELEQAIYWHIAKLGTYLCFEVGMPSDVHGKTRERVDLLSYEQKRTNDYKNHTVLTENVWRFYELKISKSDFYSRAKHTFLGQYNYYVLPEGLLKEVEKDIPDHVGVVVGQIRSGNKYYCSCVKKPKKQELKINHEELLVAFMRSLSRQHENYMRMKEKEIF